MNGLIESRNAHIVTQPHQTHTKLHSCYFYFNEYYYIFDYFISLISVSI